MKQILAMALCLCLIGTGCAVSTPGSTPLPPEPVIEIETVNSDTLAQDGTVIFTRSYPCFSLTLADADAAQVIEADLQARVDGWMADAAELEGYAQEEYGGQTDWATWFSTLRAAETRLDSQVFSIYWEYSTFSGGAHPAFATRSATYNCQTGRALGLEDILVEGRSAKELIPLVNGALASYDGLYDDHEALVGNGFSAGTVDNWYLSDAGLCFHFAPYEIGPYAAGTVTATIAYSDLNGILREEYVPAVEQ